MALGQGRSATGAGTQAAAVDVYYVAKMLDKLKVDTKKEHLRMKKRMKNEDERLQGAIRRARNANDTRRLQEALAYTKESKMENEVATVEMFQFYHTMRAMFGSATTAPGCRFLACGDHASCDNSTGRAQCKCDECFEGDGFVCRPTGCSGPTLFSAQTLTGRDKNLGGTADIAELHLTIVGRGQQIAVALRDSSQGDRGFLTLGRVKGAEVEWETWQPFSEGSPAFGPVLVGLPNGRLLVAFRDKDRDGVGYLVSVSTAPGPSGTTVGEPQALARNQAQRVALVPLAGSRAACLYSERVPAQDGYAEHAFGGAALLHVQAAGALEIMGKYHFVDDLPVARIQATAMTATSFVVAYRVMPTEGASSGEPSRELAMKWAEMKDDELVVDGHPLYLEPERSGMWARGLALVSANLVAYSYESGSEKKTKMVVIKVDPSTHQMSVTGGPQQLTKGDTKYVQAIDLPSGAMSPRTFTYFQRPGEKAAAEVCRVSPAGRIADCKEVLWGDVEMRSVSGKRLPDGRLAFAFADKEGKPYYQLVGAEQAGTQEMAPS